MLSGPYILTAAATPSQQASMSDQLSNDHLGRPPDPERQGKLHAIASFFADTGSSSPPSRGKGPHSSCGDRLSQHSTFRTQIRILDMVSNPVPHARRAGSGIAWKERRTAPHHAAVWVRVGGHWRQGRIIEWVRQIGRDGWDCVIMPDEPVNGPPWQGRYAFRPEEHPRP
jgi:hypothetical protein